MSKKPLIIVGSVVGFIGVTLLCVLLPLSYTIVQLGEYALYHSKWSQSLEYIEDFSESGRHFTGLTGDLITFPRSKGLIQFTSGYDGKPDGILMGGGNELQAWTSEGSNVYIQASYYFSLQKDKIITLYTEYGDKWLNFIVRLSFTALKATTVKFVTNDFVTNSQTIASEMEKALSTAFQSNFSGAVNLDSFQLIQISFDSDLDSAINNKLVQAFMTKSFSLDQNISITRKTTELDVQLVDNNVSRIMATQGQAKAITYQYDQLGQRLINIVGNMTTYYGYLKANLTTTATDIWKYMYVTELKLSEDLSSVTFLDNGVTKTTSAN